MSDPGIILLAIAAALLLFVLIEHRNARRREAERREKLKKSWGSLPDKKYAPEELARIPRYYEKHAGSEAFVIDDITAGDLDLFSLFARVNYCHSAAGEEVLYHRLRTPVFDEDRLNGLEESVCFLTDREALRVELQMRFMSLGGSGKYSVYDYLDQLELVRDQSNLPHYLGIAALIVSAGAMLFSFTAGFALLLATAAWQIVSYYRGKSESDAFLSTFAYILRLLSCAASVSALLGDEKEEPPAAIWKKWDDLNRLTASMKDFRKGSSILMSSSRMSGSGNPLDVLADYIRMLLHLDLIKFRQMVREMAAHRREVDELISALGEIESMISIACYRASLPEKGYCVPSFFSLDPVDDSTESAGDAPGSSASGDMPFDVGLFLSVKDLVHALIPEGAVPNTMRAGRGVLLTGSNASGKSTWLKALGLAALMAETIHTVTAKSYRAPFYRIYSSMALSDNLQDGESYYIVEIRALARVLKAANEKQLRIPSDSFTKGSGEEKLIPAPPVLCFIDEVLRGTNTIERIAASAQILMHFAGEPVLLFAATHDLELTALLADTLDNYHFEGTLDENDVQFDYLLKKGPSQTRNAIGLLKRFSYDREITERAERMAERFERTGVWSMEEMPPQASSSSVAGRTADGDAL